MDARRSYYHRVSDEPLQGATIHERFAEVTANFGEREAVVSLPQSRRLTYTQLAAAVDELARGLVALGYGRGDRIGIWSTNNIEWLTLQLATARVGAVLVNINPAYRTRELIYALGKAEIQGLFAIPAFRKSDYVTMLREAIPELDAATSLRLSPAALPLLRHIVLYDPLHPMRTERPAPGFMLWSEVIEAGHPVTREDLDRLSATLDVDDPINIQFTSGTTGFPKAVVLSHHNIVNNAHFGAQAMALTEEDRLCVPVPFYHCFGMVLANLLCMQTGACVVIPCEHFEAGAVLDAVTQERCTALHGVPTMFIAELEHPTFAAHDLHTLRTGIMAGAPCPPDLMRRVMTDMHCPEILIGYGETEASPLTHLTARDDSEDRRVNTVGRNLPHVEVKIVDTDTEQTVALGDVGEICYRGYNIMRGYYGDPDATAEAIDPAGWLRSGDLGTMDEHGYVRITGRRKEMIIRGGENIYPREIEDTLFAHPKIAEVAVFGIPHEFYGEEIAAWVQVHDGETMDAEEVQRFCRERLAHFKVPRHIRFVSEFPMTVTGKVQKFRMRELEEAGSDHA